MARAVVVATTKVGIFKQITTSGDSMLTCRLLLLLPQRQEFSSKSQQHYVCQNLHSRCCCYHKGRNFQANHNATLISHSLAIVVVATTKVGIFKQITTHLIVSCFYARLLLLPQRQEFSSKSQQNAACFKSASGCCCYHKGRNFQANHNCFSFVFLCPYVVVATTKVGIFKQITTPLQHLFLSVCCCCYHKGRNFQANHNGRGQRWIDGNVVVATTKVGIFKQITTQLGYFDRIFCCCCYHKGRNFQANHNWLHPTLQRIEVVVATTKVGIFKQITTVQQCSIQT